MILLLVAGSSEPCYPLRPNEDIALGGWSIYGAGTAWESLHDLSDLTGASGLSVAGTGGATISAATVGLTNPPFAPTTDAGHRVIIRYRTIDAPPTTTVALEQGTTVIQAWSVSDRHDEWTTLVMPVDEANAASITDYNDLRISFALTAAGVSWAANIAFAFLCVPIEVSDEVVGCMPLLGVG